jgi:tRNA uridine 5-carboxymethylaminomethyl modification enzyme
VIIATGTFLESEIFVGDKVYSAGPDGMMPSHGLSASLEREGIKLQRFKTGTPARVHRRSIDLSRLEEQCGESDAIPFSVRSDPDAVRSDEVSCHIVYTNLNTHKIINDNLDRSAMYSGNIVGTGPRYCPSIETKLVRFADKERHQLFVEPCGEDTDEMYIQGFSTSMPTDVQYDMLRSLEGFENAEIMRYAYAIEYDSAEPTGMLPTLEFKAVSGLFGAGQFNGTSGYEEAAAQGLVAGINAALAVKGEEPMILPRSSSYIGTLIDDLVTKGTKEPYRMMTSRSEYRLILRQDNADMRLTDIGRRVGLIGDDRYLAFEEKRRAISLEIERMKKTTIAPSGEVNELLKLFGSTEITTGIKLSELVKRPELTYAALEPIDKERPILDKGVRITAEIDVKYEGYIKRQLAEVERSAKLEEKRIPDDINYFEIGGLRIEAAEKLSEIRPASIGQASRISGVNPADITVLLIRLGSK